MYNGNMISTRNPCVDFNADDRCDRCGARAYACASRDGMELTFCVHHIKQHALALEDDGWYIVYDTVGLEQIAPVAVYA